MRASIFILCLALYALPVAAQDYAAERLESSPRHHEWVEVPAEGRSVHSFVAYPERAEDALAVIVIHENRGLTDWVRSFADQLAEAGYLAIAPDLLSGYDEQHGRTADFETSDAARDALYQLDPEQITRDLRAIQRYIAQTPSSNGKTVVVGFCWGGSQAFRFATNAEDLSAALVFYGSPPEDADRIRSISAPIYGFYGENDQRINATIPETEERMDQYGKTYDYAIYEGAGHAFMRSGDDPNGSAAERQARDEAWVRLDHILSGIE